MSMNGESYGGGGGSQQGLPDLEDVTLDEMDDLDQEALRPFIDDIRHAVERPRANLGGSGPPGRAD